MLSPEVGGTPVRGDGLTGRPSRFAEPCPWEPGVDLETWVSARVLRLSCTAEDLRPLGEAAGLPEPVARWNPRERAAIVADLDAAFLLLYGLDREAAAYVAGSFAAPGAGAGLFAGDPAADMLARYDTLAAAAGRAPR